MKNSTTPAARKKIEEAYNVARASDMPHNLKSRVMDDLRLTISAIDSFNVTGELPKRHRWRAELVKLLAMYFTKAVFAIIASYPSPVTDISRELPIHPSLVISAGSQIETIGVNYV